MSSPAVSNAALASLRRPRRPLRRLTVELFVAIALKMALLLLLWWLLFAPQPEPDVSAAAISRLFAPTPAAPPDARP
jgi:hypothetical protein